MPLYTFTCPRCGNTVEKLRKAQATEAVHCTCYESGDVSAVEMQQVLATPSAPQWNCRTAHSRSKGF